MRTFAFLTTNQKNMLKIESNIPIPGKQRTEISETISAMNVGDSVVVPSASASRAFRANAAYNGIKLASRKQPDGTFRVWRIK